MEYTEIWVFFQIRMVVNFCIHLYIQLKEKKNINKSINKYNVTFIKLKTNQPE